MQVKHNDMIVEAWQISDDTAPAVWVQDALQKGIVTWQSKAYNQLRLHEPDSIGNCGDYLIKNGPAFKIVKAPEFTSEYQTLG